MEVQTASMETSNAEKSMPQIAYERHPAYAAYGGICRVDEKYVAGIVEQVDRAWQTLRQDCLDGDPPIASRFEERIAPLTKELEQHLLSQGGFREDFQRYVRNVIASAKQSLLDRLTGAALIDARSAAFPPLRKSGQGMEQMARNGFYRADADARLAQELWRLTRWERSRAARRARRHPSGRAAIPLHSHAPATHAVRKAMVEKGIYELAAQYMGCEMEMLYAAVEYSHDRQSWYKGCYADLGLADARTTYMHFDADHNVLKILLYLHDVEQEGGAFSYVGGSHKWQRSLFTLAMYRGFDSEQAAIVELEPDGLDYKLGYYRPRFMLPQFRQELMKLPAILRGSTHFGDDVLDGTEQSAQLLDGETMLSAGAGTVILFDGSAGIHRGSTVRHGQRWALQIGLKAVGTMHEIKTKNSNPMIGKARYYLHRLKNLGSGS
jgi:hypothetical protein